MCTVHHANMDTREEGISAREGLRNGIWNNPSYRALSKKNIVNSLLSLQHLWNIFMHAVFRQATRQRQLVKCDMRACLNTATCSTETLEE